MTSIRKGLLQFVFSGSYMKRWNDKLRPMDFIEIDKQSHKMIVAWLLCQLNARRLPSEEDRLLLERQVIEYGMFDYFFRLVITDIKPPVYYRIRENSEHYRQLASWALRELERHVRPLGEEFWQRLTNYVDNPLSDSLPRRILDAAHTYASSWEFNILKPMNSFDDEVPEIETSFIRKLESHYASIHGLEEMVRGGSGSALGRFANLCGQLRFQTRWSQTPRIPETSVMGHMFTVACYAYFFSLAVGACPARANNNFFAGLFHDLPELLTRDIISPVKKSTGSLGDLIREYEESELRRRVLSPLAEQGHYEVIQRLSYYLGLELGSEFYDTIRQAGQIRKVDFDSLQNDYNADEYDPKDGRLLKICDTLAAFIEAYTAVRNGINSDQLQEAAWRMRAENLRTVLGNLHIGALFTDFD